MEIKDKKNNFFFKKLKWREDGECRRHGWNHLPISIVSEDQEGTRHCVKSEMSMCRGCGYLQRGEEEARMKKWKHILRPYLQPALFHVVVANALWLFALK